MGAVLLGCGSSGGSREKGPSGGELALERAQFVRVVSGLGSAEPAVRHEVGASRVAWPSLAGGLPRAPSVRERDAVRAAASAAQALPEPAFVRSPARLTGPAAGIAGIYENYERLSGRGWLLLDATGGAITAGSPADASFARMNSSLYIDSVYDAHFDLSLLGKSLVSGYQKLGGPHAFGARLAAAELTALASAYSIPAVRLEPHPSGSAAGER